MDEPTKGFTCILGYSRLKDELNAYKQECLDTTCYRRDIQQNAEGKITISYENWLMPNSSVFFAWYPKDKNLKPIARAPQNKAVQEPPLADAHENVAQGQEV